MSDLKYIVKKGDYLEKIARELSNGSWKLLASYNKLSNPDRIFIGLTILIPLKLLKSLPGKPLPKELYRPTSPQFKPLPFKILEYKPTLIKSLKKLEVSKTNIPIIKAPKQKQSNTGYSDTIGLRGLAIKSLIVKEPVIYDDWKFDTLKYLLGEETGKDIHGVLFGGEHTLKERYQMLMNGLQSKLGVGGGQTTSKIKSKLITPREVIRDTTVVNPALANESRYGDTIRVDKNFYIIPESINLNNVKLGSRNRGSRLPFNTEGGLISTYKPIIPYEKGKWTSLDSEGHINHFFGYDKSGKPKIGPLELFGPGDTMTLVFYSLLLNIPKDDKGNYLYGPGAKNAKNRKSPLVDLRGEPTVSGPGKSGRSGLLIMTGHKNKGFNPNAFEMAGGGAYMVKADNELRLIRGSVNNVMQELEIIKKNHKGHPVYLYEVDPGSYNRGLRPYDKNYSAEELASYDALNTDYEPGGHFFYILPSKKLGGSLIQTIIK